VCHSDVGDERYTPVHRVFPLWKPRWEGQ
jgi:hypothetical protein